MILVVCIQLLVLFCLLVIYASNQLAFLYVIIVHPRQTSQIPLPVQILWFLEFLDQAAIKVDSAPLDPHIIASEEAVLGLPVAIHEFLATFGPGLFKGSIIEKFQKHIERLIKFLHLHVLIPDVERVHRAALAKNSTVYLFIPSFTPRAHFALNFFIGHFPVDLDESALMHALDQLPELFQLERMLPLHVIFNFL